MYIKNQKNTRIINTRMIKQIKIKTEYNKPEYDIRCFSIRCDDLIIGEYSTMEKAQKVIEDIFDVIAHNSAYIDMPWYRMPKDEEVK